MPRSRTLTCCSRRYANQTRTRQSRWSKSDKINAAILVVLGAWAAMDRASIYVRGRG